MPSVETEKARVGLTVRLPIYLGGEISASVARARSQAAAARFQLEDMLDQVMLNVETAFVSLQNSVARFEAAAQALKSSEVSLAATRKGYEVGTRTVIDLMTAAQDHTDVRRLYYLSLYDHILARVRLKWAAGVLSKKDVADINSLLICN
jgi:outer membrane protein